MYPLARFLKRYDLLKMEIEARKPTKKQTKEQEERSRRIALIQHSILFSFVNAEECAWLEELNKKGTWTDEEIDRALAVIRLANARHEKEKNVDANTFLEESW